MFWRYISGPTPQTQWPQIHRPCEPPDIKPSRVLLTRVLLHWPTVDPVCCYTGRYSGGRCITAGTVGEWCITAGTVVNGVLQPVQWGWCITAGTVVSAGVVVQYSGVHGGTVSVVVYTLVQCQWCVHGPGRWAQYPGYRTHHPYPITRVPVPPVSTTPCTPLPPPCTPLR